MKLAKDKFSEKISVLGYNEFCNIETTLGVLRSIETALEGSKYCLTVKRLSPIRRAGVLSFPVILASPECLYCVRLVSTVKPSVQSTDMGTS